MDSSSGVNTNRQKTNQNIQVYVRVRPTNARERGIRSLEVVEVAPPKEIVARHLPDTKMTKKFTFDKVFGPDSKQCEVYQSVVAPLIEEVLSGYNCTVFAYGQTGTGKTHTMVGTECPELHSSWEDESMVGIIPRALSHLFDELRMMEVEFSMRISYLELYNEELCDLLSTDDSTKIRIFDDPNKKGSVVIQGLEEIPVHNKNDVYKLLEKGKERRKTATTLMNAQSSRSHTVFSILVHIKENGLDGEEMLKIGKLNLVDLAGSENISKAGNEKGIRARETVNINQSLLTLGRVITALVERTPHIPYRESKLTRILQESLGGRTKTSIIATISPGHKDLEETLSTLEYAHRAKNIQNKPELNQKLTKKIVLKSYTEEIDRLKRDLMAARDKNGIYLHEETYNDMQCKLDSQNRELTEKMLLLKALKDDLASKERIFNEVSLHLIEKSEELKEKEKNLQDTKSQLDQTKRVLHTTKRRYKESKILLENHVKTEKELSSQATKLIEIADVVTSETEKLHSTLEKRKDVDVKIQTACEQFTERMHNTFKKMDNGLENLQTEHLSHSDIIMDEISKSTTLNEEFVSNVIDKVKSVSTQHQSNVQIVRNCIEKYCTNLGESYVMHSSAFAAMIEELQKREDDMMSNVKKRLTDLEKIINDQNSTLNSTFSTILQHMFQNNKSLADYSINAQKTLKSFAEEVRSQLMVKQNDLSANNAASEASLQARKKILLEFIEKMDTIEREDSVRIEERKEISQFESISDRLTNNVETEIQKVGQIMSMVGDEIQEEMEILKTSQNGNNEIAQKCTEEIACTQTVLQDFDVDDKQRVQGLLESVQEYKKCADSLTKSHKDEVDKNNEESVKQVGMSLKETVALGDQERSRIKALQTHIMALNSSMKSDITEYSNSHKRHMDDCCEYLENFRKSELKTYSPSGETPSKKTYSYPRILATTSPHNLIIKRFRYENEWSDLDTTSTITEDSETTAAELSDSCIVVNSTPIRPINIGNHLQPQNSFILSVPQANNAKQQRSPRKSPQKSPNSRIKSPTLGLNNENKENCN